MKISEIGGDILKDFVTQKVINGSLELVSGFGCFGFISLVCFVIALVFLNKIALTIAIISSVLTWLIYWILKQKVKRSIGK